MAMPRLRLEFLQGARSAPIDLVLQAGACLAITGASGAGKSLLLRMVADLDPHGGEAWLDGVARSAMTAPDWRRRVCYCAAEAGWWEERVGAHFPTDPGALLERLGLRQALLEQPVRLCSTGERQRLALARSLMVQSPVLLLDEPTGALDATSTAAVEAILHDRMAAGTTMMVVTHDLAQAARLGTMHRIMRDGVLEPA